MEQINDVNKKSKIQLNHGVFWVPFIALLLVVVISFVNQELFATLITDVFYWSTGTFGWLINLSVLLAVIAVVICLFTPIGKIRFGGENAKPKLGLWKWFAISLCGGIGIGIVYWAYCEPMNHMAYVPPSIAEPFSIESIQWTMDIIFLHWSISPYALYALAGIPLALAYYNYNQPYRISSGLYFLVGDSCKGKLGTFVDAFCVFAMAGNVAQSLGLGILQIGSGVDKIFGLEPTVFVWIVIGLSVTVIFTLSSYTGVSKGISFLSDNNAKLFFLILIFVFVTGPTMYIVDLLTESTGSFITNFFERSTYMGANDPAGKSWSQDWTMFYWASWIGYAPVIGYLLARLVYGRTIREFVLVNLIAPSVFGILWFTTMSGTAIYLQQNGVVDMWGLIQEKGMEAAVFGLYEALPISGIMIPICMLATVISFVTVADSTVTSISNLCCKGIKSTPDNIDSLEPPGQIKILWGALIGILAVVLCVAGKTQALKMIATLTGIPLVLMILALVVSVLYLVFRKPGTEGPLIRRKKNKEIEEPGKEA